MLKTHYEYWEETKLIKQLEKIKGVYQEPRDSSHYKFVISAFYQDIQSNKGAIIFAVCRGKISEGLDFSDDAARSVVLIGIPYPLVIDPKTIMKKHYLSIKQSQMSSTFRLTGQQWYCQQATRALNQAIGRVIRHKEDYGNIILIDSRFNNPNQISQISSWIRDRVLAYDNPNVALRHY